MSDYCKKICNSEDKKIFGNNCIEECEDNTKVLDSISKVAITDTETEAITDTETDCQNKLDAIKNIINSTHNTRSISEICKVIDGTSGGKPKPKSKSKTKKKNYKKKTKTRRKNKRKRTKRRKTYKKKK